MSVSSVPFAKRQALPNSRIAPDRRRHRRFLISSLGRFMRANKHEFPCRLNDISVGGCAIWSPVAPQPDERIVAYFDNLGGLEGSVIRCFEGGFSMRINATAHKREKLAAQIMWLVNRHELDPAEERRHERVPLSNKISTLQLTDGFSSSCRILDVSLSGAAVATDARPPLGSEVVVGKLRARVMRHLPEGIGVQFVDIQDPEALRRSFY